MPGLATIAVGQRVRLIEINGGKTIVRRLLSLGLSIGNEVEILQRRGQGVVVAKDGNRVALGGNVAEKVMVEEIG